MKNLMILSIKTEIVFEKLKNVNFDQKINFLENRTGLAYVIRGNQGLFTLINLLYEKKMVKIT
jgi:hypothetical protein